MSIPTPKQIEEGQRASDQVWAYQSLQRRRITFIYAGLTGLLLLISAFFLRAGYFYCAVGMAGVAIFWAISCTYHWRILTRRYRKNKKMLMDLETKFGDQLPWVQEARYLAKVRELQNMENISQE